MSALFRTIQDYERFLYSLADTYPEILQASISLVRRGTTLARVSGEIHLERGYRVVVRERLSFARLPVQIDSYGRGMERRREAVLVRLAAPS